MADYIINTEAGYNKVQEAKANPGQSIAMSDGSTISFNKDTGQLQVTNKYGTNNAYLGSNYGGTNSGSSSGGSSSNSGTSGGKTTNTPYYVGTDAGYQGLSSLYNGTASSFQASDGSTWYIGSDGNAYALHNGYVMPIQLAGMSGTGGSSGWSSGGGSGGGSGSSGSSGSILDYLNGLLGGTTGDASTEEATTPTTSTVVDNALNAQQAYNDQIESYKKQLLEMQNQKTASAQDQSDYIRQMYEQQLAANKAQLESNYNENLSSLDSEADSLGANYYEQRRQAQANADKSQASFNEMANAYGLNTGTGGQAQLARNNQLQSNLTTLGNAEAQSRAEIERQRTLLGQQYQSAIQQAQAENNMELAQALYQEAVRVDESIIDASKYDSERALDILDTMLNQVSADRSLATEEARQAAEIAAAGGKYGLYGTLYGLSDDVVSQLESIYQQELSDTELQRELEIYAAAKDAGIDLNRQYSWQNSTSGANQNRYSGNTSPSSLIQALMQAKNAKSNTSTSQNTTLTSIEKSLNEILGKLNGEQAGTKSET